MVPIFSVDKVKSDLDIVAPVRVFALLMIHSAITKTVVEAVREGVTSLECVLVALQNIPDKLRRCLLRAAEIFDCSVANLRVGADTASPRRFDKT